MNEDPVIDKSGGETTLTSHEKVLYTADQVEQIVEMLFQKFAQHISSPTAANLDSNISQQPMPDTKLTLSVREAADMIGISKPTMYGLIRNNEIPVIHVGKKILISRKSLTDWVEKGDSYGKEAC